MSGAPRTTCDCCKARKVRCGGPVLEGSCRYCVNKGLPCCFGMKRKTGPKPKAPPPPEQQPGNGGSSSRASASSARPSSASLSSKAVVAAGSDKGRCRGGGGLKTRALDGGGGMVGGVRAAAAAEGKYTMKGGGGGCSGRGGGGRDGRAVICSGPVLEASFPARVADETEEVEYEVRAPPPNVIPLPPRACFTALGSFYGPFPTAGAFVSIFPPFPEGSGGGEPACLPRVHSGGGGTAAGGESPRGDAIHGGSVSEVPRRASGGGGGGGTPVSSAPPLKEERAVVVGEGGLIMDGGSGGRTVASGAGVVGDGGRVDQTVGEKLGFMEEKGNQYGEAAGRASSGGDCLGLVDTPAASAANNGAAELGGGETGGSPLSGVVEGGTAARAAIVSSKRKSPAAVDGVEIGEKVGAFGKVAGVWAGATFQDPSHRPASTIGDHTGSGNSSRVDQGTYSDVVLRRGASPYKHCGGGGAASPHPVPLENAAAVGEPTRASPIGTDRSGSRFNGGKASGEAILSRVPPRSDSDSKPETKPTTTADQASGVDAWLFKVGRIDEIADGAAGTKGMWLWAGHGGTVAGGGASSGGGPDLTGAPAASAANNGATDQSGSGGGKVGGPACSGVVGYGRNADPRGLVSSNRNRPATVDGLEQVEKRRCARAGTAATFRQHSHRPPPTIRDHTGNGSSHIDPLSTSVDVGLPHGRAPRKNSGGGAAVPPPVLPRNAASAGETTKVSLIGESGTIRSSNGGKASGEAMLPQCPLQSASDKPKEKPTAEREALGRADSFTSAWLGLVSREADLSFVPEEARVDKQQQPQPQQQRPNKRQRVDQQPQQPCHEPRAPSARPSGDPQRRPRFLLPRLEPKGVGSSPMLLPRLGVFPARNSLVVGGGGVSGGGGGGVARGTFGTWQGHGGASCPGGPNVKCIEADV
ncbi:unnamed protein product [Ectocarpus sp. 6 AP-2014]